MTLRTRSPPSANATLATVSWVTRDAPGGSCAPPIRSSPTPTRPCRTSSLPPSDYRAPYSDSSITPPSRTPPSQARPHAQRVLEQLRADGPAVVRACPRTPPRVDFSGQNTLAAWVHRRQRRRSGLRVPQHPRRRSPQPRPSTAWSIRSCTAAARCPKAKAPTPNAATPERESRLWVKAADNVGPAIRGANSGCMSAGSRGGHLRVPRLPGSQAPLVCLPLLPGTGP